MKKFKFAAHFNCVVFIFIPVAFLIEFTNSINLLCPAGYSCKSEFTEEKTFLKSKTICSVGTASGYGENNCLPCPEGYYADTVGLTACIQCPRGYECPTPSYIPVLCMRGTFSPGKSKHCKPCQSVTADGKTVYCASGSTFQTLCPPGKFCEGYDSSIEPIDCPVGFYCPLGTKEPLICPNGFYCKPGSSKPASCPLGTVGIDFFLSQNNFENKSQIYHAKVSDIEKSNNRPYSTLRESENTSCKKCPAGTYANQHSLSCDMCLAGFFCLEGAYSLTKLINKYKNNLGMANKILECPRGFFCPKGTRNPIPCPAGTYSTILSLDSRIGCKACPNELYNEKQGQIACKRCSASSVPSFTFALNINQSNDNNINGNIGATSCKCVGAHRQWNPKTGRCLCKPRYEWYNMNMELGEGDSKIDCQPKIYDRCEVGYIRNSDGQCVNGTNYCSSYCQDIFQSNEGKLSPRVGLCECAQPTIDRLCDYNCRKEAPKAYITHDGRYAVHTSSGALIHSQDVLNEDGVGMGGSITGLTCEGTNSENQQDALGCLVTHIEIQQNHAFGYLNAVFSLDGRLITPKLAYETVNYYSESGTDTKADMGEFYDIMDINVQRRLTSVMYNDSVAAAGIRQPLTCIVQGNSVLFAFTTSSWIVIVRDSTLNTWQSTTDFDPDGKFAALDAQCSQGNCPDSYKIKTGPKAGNYIFGYQFKIPGTFVFALNNDLKKQFVIVVMPSGSTCPMGTYVLPYTEANAIAMGVEQDPSLIQKPDWDLLGWLLGGLFGSVFIIIALLYYLRSRQWENIGSAPSYRERNRKMPMTRMHQKGSVLKTEEKEAAAKFTSERKVDKPGVNATNGNITGVNSGSIPGLGNIGGHGGDLERWDADDLDAREILERMEANKEYIIQKILGTDDLVSSSTSQVLAALRHESEEVKRLLAETSFMDVDGSKAKSESLLKLLENEMMARMTFDERAKKLEDECIAGLNNVHTPLQGDLDEIVDTIISQLEPRQESGHGQRRSKIVAGLRTAVQAAARKIRKLVAAFERERERRMKGITLWNAAVQHGAVELDHDLTAQLEILRRFDEKADKACRDLVGTLRSFADGSDTFVMALGQTEIACATGMKQASDQKNPAELAKVKRASKKRFLALFRELKIALERLGVKATKSKNGLETSRKQTLEQRKRIQLILAAQRAAADESNAMDEDFDHEGDIEKKHEHERKKLEKKIENEEDAHVKALESKMEAKAAKEMSDAHARAEELAKIHKAELANSNISEALQNKLMSQMDKDRDAMAHMLEEQRHRQAAAMKARLAERRIKRKKDQEKRHEVEKSEEELISNHERSVEDLKRQQQEEYQSLHDTLSNEEKATVENYMARDADDEFQIGKIGDLKELERLKKQLNADLEAHGKSLDQSRRAERERLLRKLELKKMQLQKKKEAQALIADAKGRGDDAAVQRIQDQYKHDMNNLRASADAEKRRQQEALANRLKRRRDAKTRELRRKHESELNNVKRGHVEEANNLQQTLEEDDNLQKAIEEAKKDALEDSAISNGKEELLSLVDEQAKMRDAIQKRHDQEASRLEEESEVEAVVEQLDHEQDIALAQMKLEADMQAAKGTIDGARQEARKKMLEKISKQREVAKQKAKDLEGKQKTYIEAQGKMNEDAKASALQKLKELERRQEAMENEISKGLQQFEADVSKFRDQTQGEHMRKRNMLKQKLEMKRQRKEAVALKEQKLREEVKARAAEMDEEERVRKESELQKAQNERRLLEQEVLKQQAAFESESEKARSQIKDKRDRQRDRMLEKLEKKRRAAAAERRRLEKEEAAAKQRAIEQAKMEQERLSQAGENNENVITALQSKLEGEIMRHKADQSNKKDARRKRMQERLKAKRAKKALELKKAQHEEMQEEMREQEKERHEQEAKTSKEVEAKMLEGIMIRGADENRIDEAIEIVMHDRHAKETSHLISQQYDERTSVLTEAMEDLFQRKARERTAMLGKMKADNVDEAHVVKAIEQLEAKYEVLQSDVQIEATSALDKRHAEEQLDLRQRQLAEITHAFEQLAPEDVLKQKQAEQAQRQANELQEFKEAMDREQNDQIERIKAEKKKFEDDLRRKNEEELRAMEAEHHKMMELEQREAEKKIRARKEALLKEQESQQQQQMLELGKVTEKEKKIMMQRFKADRERVQAIMEAERNRQQRALEEKLRMRRMRRALRQEEALRNRMKREHKRMQKRIDAVNETMTTAVHALMGKTAFKAGRAKGLFHGEKSAVEMSVVGALAHKWKSANSDAKKKAKKEMEKLSNGTPAERRAAREVSKGFWQGGSANGEENEAAEAQRLEKEKKANLEHVRKLQEKMEEELNKKGAEMTDRQRRQHERLLKKLELKKKKAALKAEKLEKKRKEEEAKAIEEAKKTTEAMSKAPDNVVSGFEAIIDETADESKSVQSSSNVPTMIIPEGVTKEQKKNQQNVSMIGGSGGGAVAAFDPAAEKRMFDKLNRIEEMLEQFSESGQFNNNMSPTRNSSKQNENKSQGRHATFEYDEDEDDFNSGLAERLGKYKAFQQNPELIDFLHRHE
jgi:hypothetical protein